MIYQLISVKDVVAGSFSKPEVMANVEVAKRWFNGLCAESKISRDLQLFSLGTFNCETGEIKANVEFICSCTEV